MAKFIKGLIKDTGHIDQPEGSYRYAKNAIISEIKGAIVNEHGNSSIAAIDTNAVILGSIEITDDSVVLFAVIPATDSADAISIVYLLDSSNTVTTVLRTDNTVTEVDFDLKFSRDYLIEGTYKIDPDGNIIIYWTDNNNPPRSLNVTRQIAESPAADSIYGVDPTTSPNKNYIDRINLFPHAGPVPRISFESISNGGALKTGVYYLFLAYVDKNFMQTNYVTYSLGVPIVEDDESVLPIERYDGSPASLQTGKSIIWEARNLNTDYEFLRPVVVAKLGDAAQFAFRLNDIDISGSSANVIFSGLEGYQESAVEDVIVDTVVYEKAKTIAQLDDVLYLGNLEGTRDIGFQKYTNSINLSAVTEDIDEFDKFVINNEMLNYGRSLSGGQEEIDKENGFRGINKLASSTDNRRGYTRDEVYAFYIAFILNDGSMSYAYHIPGRTYNDSIDTEDIEKDGTNVSYGSENTSEIAVVPDLDLNNSAANGEGKIFHFYDTSRSSIYNTGYWENKNEVYPNTEDYIAVDPEDGTTTDLRGTPVRHHHMPSNARTDFGFRYLDNVTVTRTDTPAEKVNYIAWSGEAKTGQYRFTDNWCDGENPPTGNDIIILPNANVNNTANGGAAAFRGDVFDQAGKMFRELEDELGVGMADWNPTTPAVTNLRGYFIWSKGTGSFSNTGGSEATIAYDSATSSWKVTQLDEDIFDISKDILGAGFSNVEYAIFVWFEEAANIDRQHVVSHDIQTLGIQLSNLKVPQDIADKAQGFRIYYAERNHANRRVLGQDVLKNTRQGTPWNNADISGCSVKGIGATDAYILSPGVLYAGAVNTATFHDSYLLNGRHSLIPATHTTYEYDVEFAAYRGPAKLYPDVEPFTTSGASGATEANDPVPSVCQDNASHVAYFAGLYYNPGAKPIVHFPLREKCKTYLNGDSIFDGTSLGFGKKIYNLGGESSIVLGFKNGRNPALGTWKDFTIQGEDRPNWAKLPTSSESDFSFSGNTTPPVLQIHSLHAFKSDMYLSYDTQELVWTGYEVLGDDFNKFIVGSTETDAFQTDKIFGGDTFIARQGYRITHRPEIADQVPRDHKSVIYTMCESTMNVNFRHETSVENSYYPASPASKMLGIKANEDLTAEGKVLYENHYSLGVSDIKGVIPYPLREADPTKFKTRVQRSAKADATSLIDNYRVFLALDFKDLPRNRGDLWKLVTFNNLLYLHTEDSLFRTKGKEQLQLADGIQSFIGSGDIFAQEPDEMVQTEAGYGGTRSQWVSMVSKHGYFCLDYRNTRVFLVKDQMYDIGRMGLQDWFRDNIPYELEAYGLPSDFDNNVQGIGFHSVFDEKYNRILLTKNDLKPTTKFTGATVNREWSESDKRFRIGQGLVEWDDTDYFTPTGWTASFDPELNVWVSFHDYTPYIYSYRKDNVLSLNRDNYNIWEHTNEDDPGNFYGVVNPFEFEFVFNASRDDDKIFYSFNYIVDVFKQESGTESNITYHNPGFTSFYLYDTHQISDEQTLEYMINTRRVGNEWKINKFRDVAKLENSTDSVYTGGTSGHTGSNFGIVGANVAGSITTSVETTTNNPMFNIDGMSETINNNFIDTTKSWHKQRKFIDKWVGIRMIASNSSRNLINLYATDVAAKKFYR